MNPTNIERFSPAVLQQLSAIEPVQHFGERVYPCVLRLSNGEFVPAAYVVPLSSFQGYGQDWIPAGSVRQILESPKRLPARFANELRKHGETGNGYYVFTVKFSLWRRRTYLTTSIDFLRYPPLTGPASMRAIVPHQGPVHRTMPPNDLEVRWCVYLDS